MIKDIIISIITEIIGLVMMPFVPLAVLFRKYVKEDKIPVFGEGGQETMTVKRYELPKWLRWFETPDERLPGGMYEPTVRGWYQTFGSYVCSVLWLWRNRAYGLSWACGKPADAYLDPVPGEIVRRGDLWRWQKDIGPLMLGAGWKVHRKDFDAHWQTGPFWAIPFITIRIK